MYIIKNIVKKVFLFFILNKRNKEYSLSENARDIIKIIPIKNIIKTLVRSIDVFDIATIQKNIARYNINFSFLDFCFLSISFIRM